MNDELESLFTKAKQERLTEQEREQMKSRLVSFMHLHPVRNSVSERQGQQSISQTILLFLRKPMPLAAVYLVIALAFGGGVSFAAERSIPGDVLYPVKVGVTEEVKSVVMLSSKGKANWEARKIERRLEEAQELGSLGKLDSNTRVVLSQKIEQNVQKAKDQAHEADRGEENQVSADINARVEAALETHIGILDTLLLQSDQTHQNIKEQITNLKVDLQNKRDDAEHSRIEIESRIKVQANEALKKSAERAKKSSERKLDEVKVFLEKQKQRLGADAVVQADARFKLAETSYAQAKTKFDAAVYAESFSLFRKAYQQAQEAKLLIDISQRVKFHLDVDFPDDEEFNSKISSTTFQGTIRSNKDVNVNVDGIQAHGSGTIKINGKDIKIYSNESEEGDNGDANNRLDVELDGNNGAILIQSNSSATGTGTIFQNTKTSIKSESSVQYHSTED